MRDNAPNLSQRETKEHVVLHVIREALSCPPSPKNGGQGQELGGLLRQPTSPLRAQAVKTDLRLPTSTQPAQQLDLAKNEGRLNSLRAEALLL